MKYYRCKCGKRWSVGSMSPRPCDGCPDCNTTLEEHPDDHKVPAPHQWEMVEEFIDGKMVELRTYCKICYAEKPKEEE